MEKKKRQKKAYTRLADKHNKLSQQAYESYNRLIRQIYLGQPILIEHHSANRHSHHFKKIGDEMNIFISH